MYKTGDSVYLTDTELNFMINYNGNEVSAAAKEEAIQTLKARILDGQSDMLSGFFGNANIGLDVRKGLAREYYTENLVGGKNRSYLWELLLAENKLEVVSGRASEYKDNGIVDSAFVDAQVRLAIEYVATVDESSPSAFSDKLRRRHGESVESASIKYIEKHQGTKACELELIPILTPAQIGALRNNQNVVAKGKDGKEYLLMMAANEQVFAYRNVSYIPKEGEAAILDRFINDTIRQGYGVVHKLLEMAEDPAFALWHREKAGLAGIENAGFENMHSLNGILDSPGNYPGKMLPAAKAKLKVLQEAHILEEIPNSNQALSDMVTRLIGIGRHAQTAEIKEKAYPRLVEAYKTEIARMIEEGENIGSECRRDSVPQELRNTYAKPRLNESYKAQIRKIMKNPDSYWQLEALRDRTRSTYEDTPPEISALAGRMLKHLAVATVRGMHLMNNPPPPKPEPVVEIVKDKAGTVAALGAGIAKPVKSRYWIPRKFNELKAIVRKN